MPLLTLITHQALDEDYLVAAHRREVRRGDDEDAAAARTPEDQPPGPVSSRVPRRLPALAVVAVFGLLIAMAAVQTSRDARYGTPAAPA